MTMLLVAQSSYCLGVLLHQQAPTLCISIHWAEMTTALASMLQSCIHQAQVLVRAISLPFV